MRSSSSVIQPYCGSDLFTRNIKHCSTNLAIDKQNLNNISIIVTTSSIKHFINQKHNATDILDTINIHSTFYGQQIGNHKE